jgi:hypothetical protein
MADFNSSLPIRTENAGDVIAKISDATIPSQQLKVNSDGSINTNFPSGTKFEVWDGTNTLAIGASGTIAVTATLLDIRHLAFATDTVDVSGSSVSISNFPSTQAVTQSGTWNIGSVTSITDPVAVTGTFYQATQPVSGTFWQATQPVSGSVTVSATALDIRHLAFATDTVNVSGSSVSVSGSVAISNLPTTADTNYGASSSSTLRTAAQIGNASGAADFNAGTTGAQTLRVAANLYDSTGTAFSSSNPLPVLITSEIPGSSISDYATATVAAGATSNHDYTVTTGKTFYLNQIEASASGKMKIEVKVNGVSKFVQFNSTATPNMHIELESPISAAAGQVVRIIMTNRDNQSDDLYSTICGYEV